MRPARSTGPVESRNAAIRCCDVISTRQRCAAHPCSKVVGTQSLGRQACEAKRDSQSQGCRGSKACRHSASDVDRRYRIQLVIKGGCQSTCIAGQPKSRRSAGTNVPAGTLALVRSPLALRCSREQNALHTLIHQRHLTPSCRGQAPTAERTLNPARMFTESLILGPELENNQGQTRRSKQHHYSISSSARTTRHVEAECLGGFEIDCEGVTARR